MRNTANWFSVTIGSVLPILFAPVGAHAQPSSGQGGTPLPANVRQDLEKLHAGNQAEIQCAQMAEQRAQSPEVKQLATTLMQDHKQLDEKLKTVAQEHGADNLEGQSYQNELSKLESKSQQQLGNKNGEAFDRAYTALMVVDHREDVHKNLPAWTKDAERANATQITTMLQDTDQTLQKHLKMATEAHRDEQRENKASQMK